MARREGGPGVGTRAVAALGLLVGFYVLATVLIVVLFALVVVIGVLVQVYLHVSVAGVGTVLVGAFGGWSLLSGLFRSAKEDDAPPLGIRVGPADEPALWAEVTEIARTAGARVPDEIYLVPDVNAFVYQRSRLLGLVRGRTVLGLGLGLVAVLDRAELRAVLVHEFGHISGGDTRLGPLLYRSKARILHMVRALTADERVASRLLALVFRSYFKLFLRYSTAVSRAQERAADRASVRVSGGAATASALVKISIADKVFDFLLEAYVAPLWERGRTPEDLYGGLRALYAEPGRQELYGKVREAALAEETGRWDSHPALGERLALIGALPGPAAVPGGGPARTVLADPDRAERAVAALLTRAATRGAELAPVAWDASADSYAPAVAETAAAFRSHALVAGGRWNAGGLDAALELIAAGRVLDLARALNAEVPEDSAAALVRGPLGAALAEHVVTGHGGAWVFSWAEGIDARWSGTAPDALADRALEGAEGVAAVRAELGLGAVDLTPVPPLTTEEPAHAG
ncbi:M48 family metallopeptidase [Actinomadura parmotrematis]|uniref:M48 family metalloprotease n=1 Tax=Actinomadura parmotrematis TaxID=2864039 RepID=A0ABS7G4I0_9ACTN|nr:M48 family metallopeptidase [Actinomadura parmotrematis]MBW8487441.1 M48 family metalloprotease [Actinomadura parmotrematis]